LILKLSKDKLLEIAFLSGFSVFILIAFYSLISMNGLVLGNDGSVHLDRAQEFLNTGHISLANLGWTPPLYQILLAFIITFTGATNIDQLILLVKISAIVLDWLLFFSVYLIGARFFNKKTGAVAAALLLLCFPMFELNMWGGYTSVLGIALMLLVVLVFASFRLSIKSFQDSCRGISVLRVGVLSHQ
jgi:4-amino-4-deoxy-L-arabinose transferase-like glycosyltransferase